MKNIKSLVFDLDDTLYPSSIDIRKKFKHKVAQYLREEENMSEDRILGFFNMADKEDINFVELAKKLDIDVVSFFQYSCDVDVSKVSKNEKLLEQMYGLKCDKFIYTNSTKSHTKDVLENLGLEGIFFGEFTVEDSGYILKPDKNSFDKFFQKFGVLPEESVFFEDSLSNLEKAKKLGMKTVFIDEFEEFGKPEYVDYVFKNINDALEMFL